MQQPNTAPEIWYANETDFALSYPRENLSAAQHVSFQNCDPWVQTSGMFMDNISSVDQQICWNSASYSDSVGALPRGKSTVQSTREVQKTAAKAEVCQRTMQRRREQNREDQRRYRARKENAIRTVTAELERSREQLEKAKQQNSLLVQQWKILEARIAQLEEENLALKAMSPAQSSYSWDDSSEAMSRVGNGEQWYEADGSDNPFTQYCESGGRGYSFTQHGVNDV